MTVVTKRRACRRLPVVPNAAVVVFKTNTGSRFACARLIDISPARALLIVRTRPAPRGTIKIRLEHPIRTPTITARVVRAGDSGDVAVRFVWSCNRTYFWTATRGENFHVGNPP
jgi:hypothetical protein